MISEDQQEQGTLYALDLLDADEADAFERELAADPALRALVRELQEAAASLAEISDESSVSLPPELRDRVLGRIAGEARASTPRVSPSAAAPVAPGKIVRPSFAWVPWSIAALLLGCSAFLAWDRQNLTRELGEAEKFAAVPDPTPPDAFSEVAFCELEPTPDAPVRPRAAVLWNAAQRKGVLRISELAPPAAGKDYQLWAVKAGSKQPVNAGVVHLDAAGRADVSFQPDTIPGDNKVVAVALSVEKAGGSPTNQGPILFLGKL